MGNDNANNWLKKALAILTTSPKPMSAKEIYEKAGSDISFPHAILAMQNAAANNLVEAHRRANKKATLFTSKDQPASLPKQTRQKIETDTQEVYYQLIREMHQILQRWITDMADVDAQLAEVLLKIRQK